MFDLRHTLAYQGRTVIILLFFIFKYCRVSQGEVPHGRVTGPIRR